METMQKLSKPPAQLMMPRKQESSLQAGFLRGARKTLPLSPGAYYPMAGYPGPHLPRLECVSAFTQTRKVTLMTSCDLFGSACCPLNGTRVPSSLSQALSSPVCTCPCTTLTPWKGQRVFTTSTKPNTGNTTVATRLEGGIPTGATSVQSSHVCCRHPLRAVWTLRDLTAEPLCST